MFAKTLIASLLLTSVSAASASEYFLVVPLPAKQAALNNINVTLRAVPLPAGVVGIAYPGFDLNSALVVTGAGDHAPGSVSWRVVAGAPGGPALRAQYALALTNEGTIAGGGGGGAGSNTATKSNVLAGGAGAGGGGGQGYGASAGGARAGTFAGAEYPSAQPGTAAGLASPGAGGAGVSSGYYPNQFSAPWYAASGAGGAGGALGQTGAASEAGWGDTGVTGIYSNPGGAAGYAVVGSSNVTWVSKGEVLGPTL